MAMKSLLTIADAHHMVKQPLLTIDHTHRKVKKVLLTEGGVHKQVWPSYVWKRFAVADAQQYYWDKYSVKSEKECTGEVRVVSSSGTKTVNWGDEIYFPRDDPPRIGAAYDDYANSPYWDRCAQGYWTGLDEGGDWVVDFWGSPLSDDCYYVTSAERVSDGELHTYKITYTKIAKAVTKTVYSKGSTSYGQVSAVGDSGAYPKNGKSGSYWYVYSSSETIQVKGSEVDTVFGDSPDDYPADGIHTDGYWYVRVDA